jgi:hypothetical protein
MTHFGPLRLRPAASVAGTAALLVAAASWAQEAAAPGSAAPAGLGVERAVVATAVESREPVGEASSFPASTPQVVFFTRITGASGETFVEHVWRHGDAEKARVRLTVGSPSWRTWSVKTLHPGSAGKWTVEVQDSEGKPLKAVEFTVEE